MDVPENTATVDPELVRACVAAMEEICGEIGESVRVVATDDFVSAVRARHPNQAWAEGYDRERLGGQVAAKCIFQEDASVDIVLDAVLLTDLADREESIRTCRHEAFHVALHQRGESTTDRVSGESFVDGSVAQTFIDFAGIAIEEFRVESALNLTYGDAPPPAGFESFLGSLATFVRNVRFASIKYQRDQDVGDLSKVVLRDFHALVTASAYLAATNAANDYFEKAADIDPGVLGDAWLAVVDRMKDVPSASITIDPTALTDAVVGLYPAIAEWLTQIGFEYEERVGGTVALSVLRPQFWHDVRELT